jgi:hypothetical protein
MDEPSFRTKTGTCTITEGRLVLARQGARGAAAQATIGSSVTRARVLYGVAAVGFVYIGIRAISGGQSLVGGLLCFFALYLVLGVVRSQGLSAASEIPLAAIQRVELHRPRPPLTRGYFVVHFTEGPQTLRRLILLPGSLTGGTAEFDKAVAILEQSGVLKPQPAIA